MFGILEEKDSKYNGHLVVKKDLVWGTYIQADGVTQSGGIAEKIWKEAINVVKGEEMDVKHCLILGLGGGSIAKLVTKNWPNAQITGVDIDQVMVDLGKKYLKLSEVQVKVYIQDAFEFLKNTPQPASKRYDLVCVDLYHADKFSDKFETARFFVALRKNLAVGGVVVFNRLYGSKNGQRRSAIKFGQLLEKEYEVVERFYPQANIMFACRS